MTDSDHNVFTPPTEIEIDHALDAAAERLANPKECACERCEDAVTDTRRELIEEGRRRVEAGATFRNHRQMNTFTVTCGRCGGNLLQSPAFRDGIGCPKCDGNAA